MLTNKAEKRKRYIESYYGLVEVVVDKLLSTSKYRRLKHIREELIGEGTIALIEAVDTYRKDKGTKPVTYFSFKIRKKSLDYIRSYIKNDISLVDIDSIDSQIPDEREEYTEEWSTFVDKYEPEDELDRRIYHEFLMGDRTAREIGDDVGMSLHSIRDRVKKLRKKLRVKINKGEE